MGVEEPSEKLTLAIADSTLAAGIRYGLWVERAPSTEEQVAVSSMSQDKLGQARQFYQIAEDRFGLDAVALQYDRDVDAFAWHPSWLVPWTSWSHFVIAQLVFGRALRIELEALAEGTRLREPLAKIEQEDSWHTRHGSGWLAQAREDEEARARFQTALDDLWPHIVTYFGTTGEERFPGDAEADLIAPDGQLRERLLEPIVPQLRSAKLEVAAEQTKDGWRTKPEPDRQRWQDTIQAGQETAVELVGMLQDPEHRELAEI